MTEGFHFNRALIDRRSRDRRRCPSVNPNIGRKLERSCCGLANRFGRATGFSHARLLRANQILRQEVESLIEAHEKESSFINSAVVGQMADSILQEQELTPKRKSRQFTRSLRFSARAGWAKFILPRTTNWAAGLRLSFCRSLSLSITNDCVASNRKPAPLRL